MIPEEKLQLQGKIIPALTQKKCEDETEVNNTDQKYSDSIWEQGCKFGSFVLKWIHTKHVSIYLNTECCLTKLRMLDSPIVFVFGFGFFGCVLFGIHDNTLER